MPAARITLDDYQKAERVIAHERARFGLVVHAIITVLISALLIVINFALVDEGASPGQLPWSVSAVVGGQWFCGRDVARHAGFMATDSGTLTTRPLRSDT